MNRTGGNAPDGKPQLTVGRAIRPLALHQTTLRDVPPERLPDLAARAGFDAVCLFTHVPQVTLTGGGKAAFPLVTPDNRKAVQQALRDTGLALTNFEYFPIKADVPPDHYPTALALGAELGGKRAVTHIHDPEPTRAVDTLGQLAALAATYGMEVGLEFMGLSPACNSLSRALWFVAQVNAANLGIGVDALHFTRTGGTLAELAAAPQSAIRYAQICDGPVDDAADRTSPSAYLDEALDRLMPGDGAFALAQFITALPANADLDVEVPMSPSRMAASPPEERAREACAKARALL